MSTEKYKVLIYPMAKQDLLDVINYINDLAPGAAVKYYDLLVTSIESLSQMPKRCPISRDLILASKGYRILAVKNYLVFYVIHKNTVQIRRILYNRRNFENLI